MGILETKCVWASVLHYLNDSQEWIYALDLATFVLTNHLNNWGKDRWQILSDATRKALENRQRQNVCVFSLSENWNQLSQWRGYCPPEGGYCLTFNTLELKRQLEVQGFELRRCDYSRETQVNKINAIFSTALSPDVLSQLSSVSENDAEMILDRFVPELLQVAPSLKSADFREEQEWRAIRQTDLYDPAMGYHIRGPIAIPHCKIRLDAVAGEFPVDQITVGPCAHRELAQRAIIPIASKAGVKSIGCSNTPLRSI